MRPIKGVLDWTFEDENGFSPLGSPASLQFRIGYTWTPGEPMVRYYRDGSGYPGSPDEIEFYSFDCVLVDGDRVRAKLGKEIGNWFESHITISDELDKLYTAVRENVME